MAKLPRIQRNMALSINGVGFAGTCESVTPPTLTRLTEDFRAGGMDGTIRIDMGQEAMEMTIVVAGTDHSLLQHLGMLSRGVPITLRTANQAQGSGVDNVTYKATGSWSVYDMGEMAMGAKNTTTITAQLTHFEIIDAGDEVLFVDVPNMVCRLRGVDILKEQRDALGV